MIRSVLAAGLAATLAFATPSHAQPATRDTPSPIDPRTGLRTPTDRPMPEPRPAPGVVVPAPLPDPGILVPPATPAPGTTRVIPPPGTPGGDPRIQPR